VTGRRLWPLLLLAAGSCGDAADGGSCQPFDHASYQASSTPSFRQDIQPVLAISCALSTSCHGIDRGAGPLQRPLLGPRSGVAVDAAMLNTILEDLLKPAERAPALARVQPGRPGDSFLVHKLDGSQGCAGIACPQGCGSRMPMLGEPLSPAERDAIRSWILQGAPNN
jgi:hypothetical protein